MRTDRFIACGMYAFTDDLRQAWQQLFDRVVSLLNDSRLDPVLVFDHGRSVLLHPNLLFGQTCGYPLMTHLRDRLQPFCVPLFDVPGCSGKLYSSQLVVAADAEFESLRDCHNTTVAINTTDSNSGMNVLRHALAGSGARGQFFNQVLVTGAHAKSLGAVASGSAQLAAIDCVTFQLIKDQDPQLVARVRSLGSSVKTCGLPFVVPVAQAASAPVGDWIGALNQALREAPSRVAQTLHLTGFAAVTWKDYESIPELEDFARNAGYPELK